MGLVNFAYGDIITLGAYALFAAIGVFLLSFGIAVVLMIVVAVGVALLMERVAFRPVRRADPRRC
jgi:branched-chain amino acid transport system permease protein